MMFHMLPVPQGAAWRERHRCTTLLTMRSRLRQEGTVTSHHLDDGPMTAPVAMSRKYSPIQHYRRKSTCPHCDRFLLLKADEDNTGQRSITLLRLRRPLRRERMTMRHEHRR